MRQTPFHCPPSLELRKGSSASWRGHSSIQPSCLHPASVAPGACPAGFSPSQALSWNLASGEGVRAPPPLPTLHGAPPLCATRDGPDSWAGLIRGPGLGERSHGCGRPPRVAPPGERGSHSERMAGEPGGRRGQLGPDVPSERGHVLSGHVMAPGLFGPNLLPPTLPSSLPSFLSLLPFFLCAAGVAGELPETVDVVGEMKCWKGLWVGEGRLWV